MYNICNIHYILYTYVSTTMYIYICAMCQCPTSPIHSILSVLFSLRSLWPQSRRRVYLRALSWHMCIVNVRPSHFYLKALSHRRFNGATRAFKDDVCSYFNIIQEARLNADSGIYIHFRSHLRKGFIYIYIIYKSL